MVFNGALALFNSPTAAFLLLPVASFQLSVVPSYRHLFSDSYGPAEQAQVFAAFSVLESIPGLFAPALFNAIYAATVGFAPPLVYLAVMFSAVVGLALLCFAPTTLPTGSTVAPIDRYELEGEITRSEAVGVVDGVGGAVVEASIGTWT